MKINKFVGKFAAVAVILIAGSTGNVLGAEIPKTTPVQDTIEKITSGLQLFAWIDKTKVEVSEPVVLHFSLRNRRKETVFLIQHIDNLPESEFYLEVRNDQDKIMPLTEYGKLVPNILACDRIGVAIKSGQEVRNKLLVSRMHDMTRSGNYSITIRTYLFGGNINGKTELMPVGPLDAKNSLTLEVISNTVRVEVIQPNRGTSPQPQNIE